MKSPLIRPARVADSRAFWRIRNHPANRPAMLNPESIVWKDHQRWFRHYLKNRKNQAYVLVVGRNIAGYLRLDQHKKEIIVSIALDPRYQGKGLGGYILREGLHYAESRYRNKPLIAEIKKDNVASEKLFKKNGFVLKRKMTTINRYVYQWPQTIVIATNHDWGLTPAMIKSPYRVVMIRTKAGLTYERLKKLNPRYVFFSHWSWLIPPEIYTQFECVVFHMADLPYGRGGTPLQNLIWRGHTTTKISAIRVVAELDAGPVYLKRPLALNGRAEEIYRRAQHGIATMITTMSKINPTPQPQRGKVVVFKRRTAEESRVPTGLSQKKMYDFIRMLDAPDYPKAFIEADSTRIEFTNPRIVKNKLITDAAIYEK